MWLCLRFALLPLESVLCAQEHSDTLPVAVAEQQRILCCNEMAFQQGVRSGQTVATGYALSDTLRIIERNTELETQWLQSLAMRAYPFSPTVSISPPESVLLEIGRSLKLYQGLPNLLAMLRSRFEATAFTHQLAIAPYPKAAELLSYRGLEASLTCWDEEQKSFHHEHFIALLHCIPIDYLSLTQKQQQAIASLGLKTLKDLYALPTATLRKRLGETLVNQLQQLTGDAADVKETYQPPVTFDRQLEFMDTLHQTQALLFPMKRLLEELVNFLRLHQKSCQTLQWHLRDIYRQQTEFSVHLAEAQVNHELYIELTRLKLESVTLTGPIESLRLTVDELTELHLAERTLFSDSGAVESNTFKDDLLFVNKIRARLGKHSCRWLDQLSSPVPELASRYQIKPQNPMLTASSPSSLRKHRAVSKTKVTKTKVDKNYVSKTKLKQTTIEKTRAEKTAIDKAAIDKTAIKRAIKHPTKDVIAKTSALNEHATAMRPSWLFPVPQYIGKQREKLYWQGKLSIISTEERIAHHWWKKSVVRDYFVAKHESGVLYWIFYDAEKERWFLHGVFA